MMRDSHSQYDQILSSKTDILETSCAYPHSIGQCDENQSDNKHGEIGGHEDRQRLSSE